MRCSRSSAAAAWVSARTPNAPAAHSPRPGMPRRDGAARDLHDRRVAALLEQEARGGAEERERPAHRHRRPVLEAARPGLGERAAAERPGAAAAVGRRGVDDEVDAAVAPRDVLAARRARTPGR